jgi:hypothetical protein
MNDAELLAEVEDLIRTAPGPGAINNAERYAWVGRLAAVLKMWSLIESTGIDLLIAQCHGTYSQASYSAYGQIMSKLNQARFDLRMKTTGPISVAVDSGGVFDYFDELRQKVESATSDIFFIDPYLDAEFVSRYLVHVREGVTIRLLAREKIATLLPAVESFAEQHQKTVYIRSSEGFHDRYVIIDGDSCYHSGASFKDGAKKSPTTLTQITDAFLAVRDTYEMLWQTGTVIR